MGSCKPSTACCAVLFFVLFAFVCADNVGSFQGAPVTETDTFDGWLKYVADTSDDDTTLPSTAGTPGLSTALGTGSSQGNGDGSDLHSKDKHNNNNNNNNKPKENRDSIGILPKPTGKAKKITVAQNGKGDFKTINEALASVTPHSKYRTIIHIKAGTYK